MTTSTSWVPSDQSFASRLALVRHEMGWNSKEAALACGLPASSWRNWEAGKRPHDYEKVCKAISDRTGADLIWLSLGQQSASGESVNRRERSLLTHALVA